MSITWFTHERICLGLLAVLSVIVVSCGKNSSLEGSAVDSYGAPLPDVEIVARQLQPVKGYDELSTTTSTDGSFRLDGLFPESIYELHMRGDKWVSAARNRDTIKAGPEGETSLMSEPLQLVVAVNETGSLVLDLETGITRYEASAEGYIFDTETALEWYPLPGKLTWFEAKSQIDQMGNGWRLPTMDEVRGLYVEGLGQSNIDPVFGLEYGDMWSDHWGSCVWTSYLKRLPFNLTISRSFYFPAGKASSAGTEPTADEDRMRAFAVRSLESP